MRESCFCDWYIQTNTILLCRFQDVGPSSRLDSDWYVWIFVFALDPYGYNEKKRRRENLMKMSGLSSKRCVTHLIWFNMYKNVLLYFSKCVCFLTEVSALSLGGHFPGLAMNRPKAVSQSTMSHMRKGNLLNFPQISTILRQIHNFHDNRIILLCCCTKSHYMLSRPQQHVPEATTHTCDASATCCIQPALPTRLSECNDFITGS